MVVTGVEDVSFHLEVHQNRGASTFTSTPHQQPSAFGYVWDHAASACDAASVSRAHTKENVNPDDHTVSACVSNDLPGVLLSVGLHKPSSSKEHQKPKLAGYQAHEHLGGGTFRYAYRAQWARIQPSLRQPLAIKLLHKTEVCKGECRHAEGNCYLGRS